MSSKFLITVFLCNALSNIYANQAKFDEKNLIFVKDFLKTDYDIEFFKETNYYISELECVLCSINYNLYQYSWQCVEQIKNMLKRNNFREFNFSNINLEKLEMKEMLDQSYKSMDLAFKTKVLSYVTYISENSNKNINNVLAQVIPEFGQVINEYKQRLNILYTETKKEIENISKHIKL